jgi:predicted nucleotidyltransferase
MITNNDSNRGPEIKAPDTSSLSKPDMRMLFMTCVGSHMWHMESKESDVDLVVIYTAPTKSILRGEKISATISQRIEEKNGVIYDTLGWEIGHLIDQLIKGNVNAIWNAASPMVLLPSTTQEGLKALIVDNLCKETYRSISGMAESQIRYEQKPERNVGKGYRTALRTINFGIELLTNGRLCFEPVLHIPEAEEVAEKMRQLTEAYEASTLPDLPDEDVFREFLLKLRLEDLKRDRAKKR